MVVERAYEGALTGTTGITKTAQIWVEGDYFHYIDDTGAERRFTSDLEGTTGVGTGFIWSESCDLHYIDASGKERAQTMCGVYPAGFPYGFCFWFDGEV
jgi:hypothetical protein